LLSLGVDVEKEERNEENVQYSFELGERRARGTRFSRARRGRAALGMTLSKAAEKLVTTSRLHWIGWLRARGERPR